MICSPVDRPGIRGREANVDAVVGCKVCFLALGLAWTSTFAMKEGGYRVHTRCLSHSFPSTHLQHLRARDAMQPIGANHQLPGIHTPIARVHLDHIRLVADPSDLSTPVHGLLGPLAQAFIEYLKQLLPRHNTKAIPVPTQRETVVSTAGPRESSICPKIKAIRTSPQTP
jgi:hypothetical protein